MQAPTMPGHSEDVFSGACPSCYYKRAGHKCVRGPASRESLTFSPSMTTEPVPTRPLSELHPQPVHSVRHGILSSGPLSEASAVSVPLERAPQVSNTQHKRKRGSQAVAPQNAPPGQDHGMAAPQYRSQSNAARTSWQMPHAYDDAVSQQWAIADDAQAQPAGGQAVEHAGPEFQDLAWDLFNRARNLAPDERIAFPDRVEAALSLMSLSPDIMGTLNRIFELPRERQAEDIRKIVNLLRQFMS